MSNKQYEREEDQLGEDLNAGRISQVEYNKQIQDMQRSYRQECEETCQEASDRERDNW